MVIDSTIESVKVYSCVSWDQFLYSGKVSPSGIPGKEIERTNWPISISSIGVVFPSGNKIWVPAMKQPDPPPPGLPVGPGHGDPGFPGLPWMLSPGGPVGPVGELVPSAPIGPGSVWAFSPVGPIITFPSGPVGPVG